MGPDYGHHIKVLLSEGFVGSDIRDLGEGSYTTLLSVIPGSNPVVIVSVMDGTLFSDRLSNLVPPALAFSVHGGIALPVCIFADNYQQGVLAEVDFERRCSSNLVAELVIGRSGSEPGFQIIGGTVYHKGYVPVDGWEGCAAVGAGAYKCRGIDAAFGLCVGVGIAKPVSQDFAQM